MLSRSFGKKRKSYRDASKSRRIRYESLENRQLLTCNPIVPVDTGGAGEVAGEEVPVVETVKCHSHHIFRHHGRSITRAIADLSAGIESGDLPGDVSAEDAKGIIDGLNAATDAGDRDAVSALLGQIASAKKLDSVRAEIAGHQAALDAVNAAEGTTLYGIAVADAATALQAANDALAAGDVGAADVAVDVLSDAQRAEARAARKLARYSSYIERLNGKLEAAAEAGDTTYKGVPIADAQAFAASATTAMAAGDVAGAKAALGELSAAQRLAKRTARATASVESLQAKLAAAGEAGEATYGSISLADAQGFADTAKAALDTGDLDGVNAALSGLKSAQRLAGELSKADAAIADLRTKLDAAIAAGEATLGDATVEEVTAAIASATELRTVGDLASAKAAQDAIKAVTPSEDARRGRHHHRNHGSRWLRWRRR